jgi:hypothetical protein
MGIIEAGSIEEYKLAAWVIGVITPYGPNFLGARMQIVPDGSTIVSDR